MIDQTDRDVIIHDLIYKVAARYSQQGMPLDVKTVVVHPGPRAWKEVSLLTFLNAETGEIHRRVLRARTWHALRSGQDGGRYDFSETAYNWHCEGEQEIEAIRALLNNELPTPGRYRLIQRGSEFGNLVDQLEQGEITTLDIARVMEIAGQAPDLVAALAASRSGSLMAEAVELRRRRDQLDKLRMIVEDPNSTERDHIHPLLKQMTWIFGGRYVGETIRRQLSLGDVLDVPLLRADGSLHVVELKGANIPNLVRRHRGPTHAGRGDNREELSLIPGAEIHEAYCQAMNYLCHLDEDRDRILVKLKIEARRASATVLIGHPKFVTSFSDIEIAGALRVYNSDHSRIEVMHYQDLIENAERALALAANPPEDREFSSEPFDDAPGSFAVTPDESDPWGEPDFTWSDEPPF